MEPIKYRSHEYGVRVPIENLKVDMDVQRALVPARVSKLDRQWDSALVGELLVFEPAEGQPGWGEDDTYLVGDGHHRQVVANAKGVREMDCEVFRGVSKQDQARVFLGRNDRGSIGKTDRDRNMATLRDPDTLMINAACQKAGLVFIGNSREEVTFGDRNAAVAIIHDAERRANFTDSGAQHLADVMCFYTQVFEGSLKRGERVEPMVLQGLSKLFLKKPDLNREHLAQRLMTHPPQQIVASARLFRQQVQRAGKSMGAVRACGQLMADWYNTYSFKEHGKRIGNI